jgi:polysaccharide transporter, PST family
MSQIEARSSSLAAVVGAPEVQSPASRLLQRGLRAARSQQQNLESFGFLVLVQLVTAGVGIATQIKIANTLSKELFGQITFGLLIGTYAQAVIRFGLERTLVRDIVQRPDRAADLVHASLVLRYAMAAGAVLGLLIWKVASPAGGITWGIFLVAVSWSLLALDLQPLYDAWQRIPRHCAYYLVQRAVYFVAIWTVILVSPRHVSVGMVGVLLLVTTGLYLFLQHSWAVRRLGPRANPTAGAMIRQVALLLRQNWLVFLGSLGTLLAVRFNQLFLKQNAGYGELGTYAVAWQIVVVGILYSDYVSRMGRPAMARLVRPNTTAKQRIRFLAIYSTVMVCVAIPMVLVMTLLPGWVFRILVKPEYASGARAMPILGLYLLLSSFEVVATQYVLNARLEKAYFGSVFAGAAVSIGASILLIPKFGCTGAAWSLVLAAGVTMLANAHLVIADIRKCSRATVCECDTGPSEAADETVVVGTQA